MYHCQTKIYLIGQQGQIFMPLLKAIPPLTGFSHDFWQTDLPDNSLISQANLILADWQSLPDGFSQKNQTQQQTILLTTKEELAGLNSQTDLSQFADIWFLPLEETELRLRFAAWQRNWKQAMDLQETKHFFDAAINGSPNHLWFKTKDGIHEIVNDSFCQTVNKTKDDVQGRSHAYIWDVEEDDPACIESENVVMTTKETHISEETVQTGAGQRLLTTYKSPLYNIDGSVMGTVGVAIDITQEQAYKQALLQKTQELEHLFTTMDCGVICHSLDGNQIISINQAALKILGYKSLEQIQSEGFKMVANTVPEDDREYLNRQITTLKEVGDSVNVEYRVLHENGDMLHIVGNIKLLEKDGRRFYQRFLLDITAQKLQELQRWQETEQYHAELLQALAIDYNLVCFFDLANGKGLSLRVNNCQYDILNEIFGHKLHLTECMDAYINSCVYNEDKELIRKAVQPDNLRRELAEKNTFSLTYRTNCQNEMHFFQLKIVRTGTWKKNQGIVLGICSVDSEIRNEMKKKSLLEDALLQANRANKAKSEFLSNMSHDIRTPMNAIVGFTTLAITHVDNREQVEEYLKKIMTSGNHLLSLINDILDMSRIESGKMNLDEKPCTLPDILHAIRNIVQADIHAKQLEFYIDAVDVFNENIFCDRLRLNQVLLNLLSNSIKYTGSGGIVSLRIAEKPGAAPGYANYEFHIKDTGIGMSQEFVEHIFEPFERERNSTISGIQGTGLGMAITKNILNMMNGSISVQSKQGVGTEFIVSLTFRLNTENHEPPNIPELKNCRALVVDDDFNTCDSVSYMLQQIGMRAEWTLSGKEAVLRTRQAISRKDNYCVYIIDWLLPDMNGIEVCRRIRKEIGDDVPIIVLTAYDWSDIEDEALEAGVTAFCSKPLFFSELRRCLRNVIDAENTPHQTETELKEVKQTADLHTGRILLAEDNELNQEIAVAILEEAGFTIEVANNGQIAVDMVKKSEPGYYRLILMDIRMPVMDGFEAARAIRKLENRRLARIPILAMTANAFEEDKQEALRSGMNAHIAKPIDIKKLFDALDSVLV